MANPSVVFATAGYDHTIRFWDATTGSCTRTLQFRESAVNKLDLTSDKSILAAAGNPFISLFNVASPNLQPIMNYEGHNNNVMAVGFQKESKWMFSASEDGTVKVWDLRAQGAQQECEAGAPINYAVLHPNEVEILSVDQGGSIRVWDLAANACSCELVPDGDTPMRSISVSSDGYLVVAANNKGVCYVWRRGPQGFEPLHKLQAHSEHILKCLLSPDGRMLATTSSDTTVKLWSVVDNFQLQGTLSEHKKWVWDCVYSVDAAYLVTASSDSTAKLWDLSVGSAIRTYSGHQKACVCCALNDSAL